MNFTEQQFNILSEYEDNFNKAVKADYSPRIGRTGFDVLYNIWRVAIQTDKRINGNCSHCVHSMLKDLGRMYFEDKEKRAAQSKTESKGKTTRRKKTITEAI